MNWKFHPKAAEEYLDACKYYSEVDAHLASAFVGGFERAIGQIVNHPTTWRKVDEDIRLYLLLRFPYGVYYLVEAGQVLIVAVMHMRRNPGYWCDRILK